MTTKEIRDRLEEMASHITFEHDGNSCGVDPLSATHFDMWCGESVMTAGSLDEVMNTKFFVGKSLSEISANILVVDW